MKWTKAVKVVSMAILPLAFAVTPAYSGEAGNGDGGGCYSGGVGSSSCAIGADPGPSCSVSCNSGYYACCTFLGGCVCNTNLPSPPRDE